MANSWVYVNFTQFQAVIFNDDSSYRSVDDRITSGKSE